LNIIEIKGTEHLLLYYYIRFKPSTPNIINDRVDMFTSKILLLLSTYFIYQLTIYFMSFVNSGFPSWGEKSNIGSATYSLFFAPYGAILGIAMISPLVYISIRDIYKHYISNESGFAEILKIEPSRSDIGKSTPINITVILNGVEVTYDFTMNHYQEIYSIGDKIPVRFRTGKERNSVLNENLIDLQYNKLKN
jgi:hypothetical protein